MMRKHYGQAMSVAVLAISLLAEGTALAQSPDITSFQGNGELTWTNSNTNLFYRVEWAPSLAAPDAWHSNFVSLIDIRSSASIVTSSVPMFYRVCGSSNRVVFAAPVQMMGQATSHQTGDDGYYRKGVAWPNPRFAIQEDTNCVLDNLTGLIWARNASLGGARAFSAAIIYCEGLTYGGQNDWRLPNRRELFSLIDDSRYTRALCNTAGTKQWTENDPFTGVQNTYWSSTMRADNTGAAWGVSLTKGAVFDDYTYNAHYVWPVRGGQ